MKQKFIEFNEKYKDLQRLKEPIDGLEFERQFLLSLDGIEVDELELIKVLFMFLGVEKPLRLVMPIDDINRKYLLSVGYKNQKAEVKENYKVWFNLSTGGIGADKAKVWNCFIEDDNCILIDDYRILGLKWNDLL